VPLARPVADACSVEIVTDASAFERLEPEWNDAVERAGTAHPFLRHEWLRTWWECFGEGRQLHIVIVRADAQIIAIAPLLSEAVSLCGIPVRQLRLMFNDHTPRADVIVAEPGALLAFTGPRVVQQTTKEQLPADFGRAESNLRFGHIDAIVPRPELKPFLARLLRLFSNDR
jgi:hypothetical protein